MKIGDGMRYCDLTLSTPAENLACDEALLQLAEEDGAAGEILRVWEPMQYFVVVGYANRVATEVNLPFCQDNGVPVLRRCTGGGTVLQGPGFFKTATAIKPNRCFLMPDQISPKKFGLAAAFARRNHRKHTLCPGGKSDAGASDELPLGHLTFVESPEQSVSLVRSPTPPTALQASNV